MILIIKNDNGEQWEDYHSWNEIVFDIDTVLTGEELKKEYNEHMVKLMAENRITVNPAYLNIMMESKIKNKKLHAKILKEWDFVTWLKSTYTVTELKFQEVML